MIHQLNSVGILWTDAVLRASLQGGIALVIAWGLVRLLKCLPAAAKVWIWRIAYLKFLIALIPLTINLPILSPTPVSSVGQPAIALDVSTVQPASLPHAVIRESISITAIVFLLWCLGILGRGGKTIQQALYVRGLRTSCKAVCETPLRKQIDEWAQRMRIRRSAPVVTSEICNRPVLIGILKPMIVLPEKLLREFPEERLGLVIAHELAHFKRRDLLWAWFPTICEILFFFHPLLWLARKEHYLAQEMACDEMALQATQAAAADYGATLLECVQNARTRNEAGAFAIGIFETKRTLERRLMAMKQLMRHSRLTWAAAACVLVGGAAAVLPWRAVAQDAPQERVARLEEENASLRAELKRLKEQSENAQQVQNRNVQREQVKDLYRNQIMNLDGEHEIAREKLSELSARYTENHPSMQAQKARIRVLEERQAKLKEELRDPGRRQIAQRELYEQELALAEQQVAVIKRRLETGKGTPEQLLQAMRELYDVKRQIALSQSDMRNAREATEQQIALVTQELEATKKRIRNGTQAPEEEIPLQREILRLKRELLNYQ